MSKGMYSRIDDWEERFKQFHGRLAGSSAHSLDGDLKNWLRDMQTARLLCAAKSDAWNRLRTSRAPARPPSMSQPLIPSALAVPGRNANAFDNDGGVERVHRLQIALTNSWALYEIVWCRLIWPLLPPSASTAQQDRMKTLTDRAADGKVHRILGWARFINWNAVGEDLDFLWQLRCVVVHEPGLLLAAGLFLARQDPMEGLSWAVKSSALRQILQRKDHRSPTVVRESVEEDEACINLADRLTAADPVVERAIGDVLDYVMSVATAALDLHDR